MQEGHAKELYEHSKTEVKNCHLNVYKGPTRPWRFGIQFVDVSQAKPGWTG